MSRFIAALSLCAAALSQSPSQPTWPEEFTAEISHIYFYNATRSSQQCYSTANQAILDDFSLFSGSVILQLFSETIEYEAWDESGTPRCVNRPTQGAFFAPKVSTFKYDGTSTYNGVLVYIWTEPKLRKQTYYTTADAAEDPIAFIDESQSGGIEFKNFKPVSNWPANTFAKPKGC